MNEEQSEQMEGVQVTGDFGFI